MLGDWWMGEPKLLTLVAGLCLTWALGMQSAEIND